MRRHDDDDRMVTIVPFDGARYIPPKKIPPRRVPSGKFLLWKTPPTLFRSWLASLAVGLMTLVSQVRAQRHSRIACYIVFFHRRNFPDGTFLGGIFLGGIYRLRWSQSIMKISL